MSSENTSINPYQDDSNTSSICARNRAANPNCQLKCNQEKQITKTKPHPSMIAFSLLLAVEKYTKIFSTHSFICLVNS